jgi:hypothetical protein
MKVLMKRAALEVARAVFMKFQRDIFRYYCIKSYQIDEATKSIKTKRGGEYRITTRQREWRRLGSEYRLHVGPEPWFFDDWDNTTYSLSPTWVRWICEQLDIDFKDMVRRNRPGSSKELHMSEVFCDPNEC